MSLERRATNPGKRERLARKRHKRGKTCSSATQDKWLKVGHKHFSRLAKQSLAVADPEKAG